MSSFSGDAEHFKPISEVTSSQIQRLVQFFPVFGLPQALTIELGDAGSPPDALSEVSLECISLPTSSFKIEFQSRFKRDMRPRSDPWHDASMLSQISRGRKAGMITGSQGMPPLFEIFSATKLRPRRDFTELQANLRLKFLLERCVARPFRRLGSGIETMGIWNEDLEMKEIP